MSVTNGQVQNLDIFATISTCRCTPLFLSDEFRSDVLISTSEVLLGPHGPKGRSLHQPAKDLRSNCHIGSRMDPICEKKPRT